jgi:hypothetical protein
MGKFYGPIGYAETSETSSGVWTNIITERYYRGDIIRNSKRWNTGENVNDDLQINNEISILADPFAYNNFHNMKYITWMGADWKITNINIQRPRLLLTIGGVYNGEKPIIPVEEEDEDGD